MKTPERKAYSTIESESLPQQADKSMYDDIINLPRHISSNHPPMSLSDRAAQFSPFAALTGYEAVIDETARLTQEEAERRQTELFTDA